MVWCFFKPELLLPPGLIVFSKWCGFTKTFQ